MHSRDADRNLLFGILALQMDFITRDALIAAMAAWVMEKHRPIGDILVERGNLDPVDRAALDPMIARHLARHGGDPAASLAALSSIDTAASALRRSMADPEVLESLAFIPPNLANDPYATQAPKPSTSHPSTIRYTKVRGHARGGLGVVFVARDAELNREVALKEIQDRHADDPTSQARFLLEAEITGGLEHPGVVPVYGLGAYEDGRPFYAMRFIRGDSLKDAIAAFHADEALKSDPGARNLELQKLLRRFLDVCNAIEYAHSRGVLHRDLKPDNVMVGRYGETLVVDWGLAKSVGRPDGDWPEAALIPASASGTAETLPGSVIGTPAYMSPEQAEARFDLLGPASDVYSLGATLYTLLTGLPPFASNDAREVVDHVIRGQFPRPRQHARWIDPALEAICLKAMALNPADRYPTPSALARDIERWIADEPVTAHREPFVRRARRWARRHRTAVTTALASATVAAAILGGIAWTTLAHQRRVDADGLATLARAEFLEADARKTSDPARWKEVVAEARQAEAQLESGGGSVAAKSRARARLGEMQEALRVVERDREMAATLEEARLIGANVKEDHFDTSSKTKAILAAFQSYGIDLVKLSSEEAASRVRSSRIAAELIAAIDETAPRVAKALREPLSGVARMADTDEQRADIRERIARRDFEGLRRLVSEEAGRRKLGARCRTIFNTLATLDPMASIPVLEAIHRENRADFWLTHGLARACQDAIPPRLESAIRYYHAAAALKPTSPGVLLNLGSALDSKGELDAAIVAYGEAIRLKPDYADAHTNLGAALDSKGEFDAAIAAGREAIRLKPDLEIAHHNLGHALNRQGKLDQAIAEYREAIRYEPDHAQAHYDLGVALSDQGKTDAAIAEYREAIRLKPDHAEALDNLGNILNDNGDLDGALIAYREAARAKPGLAEAHSNIGHVLLAQGDMVGGVKKIREALSLDPNLPIAHLTLGNVLRGQGDIAGAIAENREAIRIKPDFAEAYCNLGLILKRQGLFADALKNLERGHELGSRNRNWRYPSAQWVRESRRLVQLEAKLPAILKGEARPVDAEEGLALAGFCYDRKLHAASARFYGEAIAARPALGDDLQAGHRYNAACAASLAGSGQGQDEPPPDDAARLKLREQARDWLRADLAAWGKVLDGGKVEAIKAIVATLDHWKVDTDLAVIRDEASLAKLPGGERDGFRSLWADVEALRVKADAGK